MLQFYLSERSLLSTRGLQPTEKVAIPSRNFARQDTSTASMATITNN